MGVYISANKTLICFETDIDGFPMFNIFITSAACCNEVWIEHINGIKNLRNQKITEVISKTEDIGEDEKGNYLEKILYTFITKKGYFDIELRNSHNEYYGGYLEAFESSLGKLIIPSPETIWKKITEDF